MLRYRFAKITDLELYYRWANDHSVRENSFHPKPVVWESHVEWFQKKLNSPSTLLFLFLNSSDIPVGQVRIDTQFDLGIIDFSVSSNHRGKSYGAIMLKTAAKYYLANYTNHTLKGYVKLSNIASQKSFVAANFTEDKNEIINAVLCKSYTAKK